MKMNKMYSVKKDTFARYIYSKVATSGKESSRIVLYIFLPVFNQKEKS